MSKPLRPMHHDAGQPAAVRELLDAGVRSSVEYDVSAGLARHVAHVKAGTPVPDWAAEVLGTGSGAGAGATGAGAAGTAVGWIAGSLLVGAVVVGTVVMTFDEDQSQQVSRVTIPSAPMVDHRGEHRVGSGDVDEDEASAAAVRAANERSRRLGLRVAAQRRQVATSRRRGAPNEVGSPQVRQRRPGPNGRHAMGGGADSSADTGRSHGPTTRTGDDILRGSAEGGPSTGGLGVARATNPEGLSNGLDTASGDQVRHARDSKPGAATVLPSKGRTADPGETATDKVMEPRPKTVRRPAPQPSPDPDVASDHLEREMRMLKVAQAVLLSNPERALRLTQQGEREFGGSLFAQERQHLLILSLVQLGRMDSAKRHAADYLRRYPHGPFSDRVRKALASGRVPR